ncbi:uncharacterized protein MKZ38_008600 [Zalerion maritima]|uniref:Ubiquitin-conjugating enzyme E2 Z n=1 Tax=Zalerion maritima TaxID=339359 RepID=A0AAD5RYN9_9PEZI|nr:uncharacterized protein MKZ38_008600 [Zalerion maritima]
MADQSIIRITKELSDLQRHSDLSLAVACKDADVRYVKALIVGPHETPYEFGFFEFAVKFNKGTTAASWSSVPLPLEPVADSCSFSLEYPRKSPQVTGTTTNGGRCRFNPNIYASGKVCLSILGTWRGERGEEWSAAQGLESILLSIQSLMSANPFENEPGYEDSNGPEDKKLQKAYVQKIRHESLRISVIQRMEEYLNIDIDGKVSLATQEDKEDYDLMNSDDETNVPFEPFKDLCKRRFLWYYESYLAAIQNAKEEVKDSQPFMKMPFECTSNTMDGKFNYTELERRLRTIKKTLDDEAIRWAGEGLAAKAAESTVAVNLQRQYEQVVELYKQTDTPHDVQLVDNNPFVWSLTYFGKPMTNLDGALLRIVLRLSPRFPEEQPRVTFETSIFHHRISPDGTPCYTQTNTRREDIKSHLDAIIETLEEENPPYDPRTLVFPEAFKLYWGKPEDRRVFSRRLRRSAQQSVE